MLSRRNLRRAFAIACLTLGASGSANPKALKRPLDAAGREQTAAAQQPMAEIAPALANSKSEIRNSKSFLIVLHTSDLHGRVHPHDALADRDFGQGLARVAAAVKKIRAEGPTLLLDSGDTIEGSPAQALAFSGGVGDGTDPIVRAMNLLRYDAMAVGNHDFDFGLARLEKSRREARFPWLSANIVREDGSPPFPPYLVKAVAGARVGILGLVTKLVPVWEGPRVAGLKFLDEHKDVVEDIFDRVTEAVEEALGGAMVDVNQSVARLMKTVYRKGWRGSDDARRKIAEILARATKEIEDSLA